MICRKPSPPLAREGRIMQCGAAKGHKHAHVQLDEASGGLYFWDDANPGWHWWYSTELTEAGLENAIETARTHKAPLPAGISYAIFKQAIGGH